MNLGFILFYSTYWVSAILREWLISASVSSSFKWGSFCSFSCGAFVKTKRDDANNMFNRVVGAK